MSENMTHQLIIIQQLEILNEKQDKLIENCETLMKLVNAYMDRLERLEDKVMRTRLVLELPLD